MGVVFEARDLRIGRVVALKVLNREKQESNVAVQRFEREARSSAKLQHPNICAVYETGEVNGVLYFTMELVKGPSLAKLIEDRGGGLPWRKACALARDVALALAHAHETGVLHRDVKPSNVIVDELGRAKVVDFGLAREEDEVSRLTRTGSLLGTPAYMAPERFDRERAGEAGAPADIYALGVTLYEALAGWPPYEGDSLYEIMKLVREGEPPPLETPEGAPPELVPLVMKLIERDPIDRPASAASVARALDDLIAGRHSARGSARAWIRRNPRTFIFLCAATPVLPVLALTLALEKRAAAPPRGPDVAPIPTGSAIRAATSAELMARARVRVYAGDFDGATALYDSVLAATPGDEDALAEKAAVPAIVDDLESTLAARPKLEGHEKHVVARIVLAVGAVTLGLRTDPGPVSAEERAHPLGPVLLVLRADAAGDAASTERLTREAFAKKPDCGWLAVRVAWIISRSGKPEEALALLAEPRTYEGVAVGMRAATRGSILERLGRLEEAERSYEGVKTPPRLAARARARRASILCQRGDLARAVEAHAGNEPGAIDERLYHGFVLYLAGRSEEGRAVLDTAVELADEVGDEGAQARAAGDGKAVLDACRALRRKRARDPSVLNLCARAHGLRGRFAARLGDLVTARDDLERIPEDSPERGALEAVIKIRRGDFAGALAKFVATSEKEGVKLPRDAHLDFALSIECSGDEKNARDAYKGIIDSDRLLGPFAKLRLDGLDAVAVGPGPLVLVDEGPSDTLMTGGADGQGPRLFTGARWVENQETVYGFAPTIRIPLAAAGRTVAIDVGSATPLAVHIIRGAPPRDEHSWWTEGYEVVERSEPAADPKVEWKAQPGTWTIHLARVLPKDAEQKPVPLRHVRVTIK